MSERPNIDYYEANADGIEQPVHRPMTDDEYAEHLQREQVITGEHPLIAQVQAMSDDEKTTLREALG
jgi:hypothetical protein